MAVGRQSEIAMPCSARRRISSIPVRTKAVARRRMLRRRVPRRFMGRGPRMSAREPARIRHVPLVRLWMNIVNRYLR